MRTETAELMALIYEHALKLESSPPGSGGGLLERMLALGREAPAEVKAASPAFPWAEFGYLEEAAKDQKTLERELKLSLPRLKAGVLSEFGLSSGTLVFHGRTTGCYAVIFDSFYKGRTARLLFMDGALSSSEFEDGSPALEYPAYAARTFGLAEGAREGLVLGVAGGTLVELLKKSFPLIHVDGVDIDPEAMELGKRFFSLKEDGRTTLHVMDARRFVQNAGKRYGIIMLDTYKGLSPIPHLSTVEFARELQAALAPGGICVVNLIARIERSGYLQYAYDTYRTVFRNVLVLPIGSEGDLFNVILLATDRDVGEFEERNRDSLFRMRFDPAQVLTDRANPIGKLSPY